MKEIYYRNIRKVYSDDEILISRDCSKCGKHLFKSDFPPTKSFSKDGIKGKCKECTYKYFAEYEKENRVKLQEYRKNYYKENYDEMNEKNSLYYQKNREHILEHYKNWAEENKEHLKEYKSEWQKLNKEHIQGYKRAYYKANESSIVAYKKQWGKENKHKTKVSTARRKALIKKLPYDFTEDEWIDTCSIFDGKCSLTNSKDITLDHFIPVGIGHGGTVTGNCVPLEAGLNYSKNNENPFEWIKKSYIVEKIDMNKWEFLIEYLSTENNLSKQEYKEFIYWCFDNPRKVDDITNDTTSLDLWFETRGVALCK